jgi:hypothetical protein
LPGHSGPTVGGISAGLFVPHVNDLDTLLMDGVHDRPRMPSVDGKEIFYPFILQYSGNNLAPMYERHKYSPSRGLSSVVKF